MIVPRVIVLWALLRTAVALLSAFAPDLFGAATPPAVPASVAAPDFDVGAITINTAATALLLALDLRATRELQLLANLGIGLRHVLAITAAVVVGVEMLFRLATALLGGSA